MGEPCRRVKPTSLRPRSRFVRPHLLLPGGAEGVSYSPPPPASLPAFAQSGGEPAGRAACRPGVAPLSPWWDWGGLGCLSLGTTHSGGQVGHFWVRSLVCVASLKRDRRTFVFILKQNSCMGPVARAWWPGSTLPVSPRGLRSVAFRFWADVTGATRHAAVLSCVCNKDTSRALCRACADGGGSPRPLSPADTPSLALTARGHRPVSGLAVSLGSNTPEWHPPPCSPLTFGISETLNAKGGRRGEPGALWGMQALRPLPWEVPSSTCPTWWRGHLTLVKSKVCLPRPRTLFYLMQLGLSGRSFL